MNPGSRLPLLFDWPSRHVVHIALPLMLVISVLAHLVGLAAFQLSPPAAPAKARRSANVYFLGQSVRGADEMSSSIAASDPSLFSPSATEERDIWRLPSSDYTPSFDEESAAFRRLPPPRLSAQTHFLPSGPVATPSAVRTPPSPLPSLATQTRFSPELAVRTPSWSSLPSYEAPAKQYLLPADFLVAVSPEGRVTHAFPISSSGYEALDRQALKRLYSAQFLPSKGDSDSWGEASFLWGNDIHRQNPQ